MSIITFEIKGTEYKLPDYLSIDNYVKIYKVKDFLGERYFQAKLISTITGAEMDDVLLTNHNSMTFLANHLTHLFPSGNYPFIDKFMFQGVEYGFIPSWKNMSFAEFVDLDTLLNKPVNEIMEQLHIICAIMYRPIISKKKEHKFEIEPYDPKKMIERAELFRTELDVKYVLGGQFFFSNFVKKYSELSPQSLTQKNRSMLKKIILTWKLRKTIWKFLLNKRSDGTQLSIDYVKMTLQNTKPSLRKPFWKHLISYFTSWKKTNT